ncbi:MAG: hypothetical protein ACK4E3_06035 [Brevundimonas sp.]|uniref:hypothetical protein n=1 Tax=Brevundimonas sp. TaxID=1871086 RepID=UPI00391AC161
MKKIAPSTLIASLMAASAVLAGCVGGPVQQTYAEELAALSASCEARGGILTPAAGAPTGRVATDHVCEIRDGGSRVRQ